MAQGMDHLAARLAYSLNSISDPRPRTWAGGKQAQLRSRNPRTACRPGSLTQGCPFPVFDYEKRPLGPAGIFHATNEVRLVFVLDTSLSWGLSFDMPQPLQQYDDYRVCHERSLGIGDSLMSYRAL
jgi:hypothetical protein